MGIRHSGVRARTIGTFGTVALVIVAVLPAVAMGAGAPPAETVRVIVGFQSGVPDALAQGANYHGAVVVSRNDAIHFLTVETNDPAAFEQRVRQDPTVVYVEQDVWMKMIETEDVDRAARAAGDLAGRRGPARDVRDLLGPSAQNDAGVMFTPNDPAYGSQQYGPQQVRANLAWDKTLGSTQAAVCIADTGIRYTHEDLAGSRWMGGHDYINGDTDPWDDHGHGTHVAGTAAATINNGKGIAGIGNVLIYATKVLDSGGSGSWTSVANGITWCADNTPARTVISLSLGGSSGAATLENAVNYAYNTKGKLVVAASGNDYCDNCVGYPAKYANAIAVTCTTSSQASCSFTSKGPEAELAAPGYDIYSTCYSSNTAYCKMSGTSMSTPHVSGVAALVWSQHTSWTNAQLRQKMRDTAVDLGASGKDNTFGYGRIDAKNLMDAGGGGGGSPVTLFSETFDSGSANGWSLGGLWHVTTCKSNAGGKSLGYNRNTCPTDYNVGTTAGDAITPSVTIPSGATNVQVSWKGWHDTETGTSYDKKLVYVSANGGSSWTQIHQEDGTQQSWLSRSVDLSSYAGSTIKVRFRFDSVDDLYNTYEGWYLDTVAVTGVLANANPPTAPQNVDATSGPNRGEISLTWQAPSADGGSPVTGYTILRATSSNGAYSAVANVGASTLSWKDTNLGDGQTRYYVVTATNIAGESPRSNEDSATTFSLPGAPRNVWADPGPASREITVSWDAPSNTGGTALTSYRIYRDDGTGYQWWATVSGSTRTYTDTGLQAFKTYYYSVTAVNVVGEGAWSWETCSKPAPWVPNPVIGACAFM